MTKECSYSIAIMLFKSEEFVLQTNCYIRCSDAFKEAELRTFEFECVQHG